jgi:hypothetical protein
MNVSQCLGRTLGWLVVLGLAACEPGHRNAEARARQAVQDYVRQRVEGRGACPGRWRYVPGAFTRIVEFSGRAGTRYQMQHTYGAVWDKGDSIVSTNTFFVDSAGAVSSLSLP